MDGITLYAVKRELEKTLLSARIEKIFQPSRDELVLLMRTGERLLLCASPDNCRVQLTQIKRTNPAEPPVFCMFLRKVLGGGKIIGFEQNAKDRALTIKISATDELGDERVYSLIAEIMGRHSNVVLVKDDGVIAECMRRVTPAISSYRVVLPGAEYIFPPAQDKLDPTESDINAIGEALLKQNRVDKAIIDAFSGLSPQLARLIAARAAGDSMLYGELTQLERIRCIEVIKGCFDAIGRGDFSPTVTVNDELAPVSCLPFCSPDADERHTRSFRSMSEALDFYYRQRDVCESMHQKGGALLKIVQNNIERCRKNLAIQHDILIGREAAEKNRLYGELINANLYRMKRGETRLVAENYYAPDEPPVSIPLDPTLSPTGNAQRYYKKYAKAKTAAELATERIEKLTRELEYFESQQVNLGNCTEETELLQIRQELLQAGYIKPDKSGKKAPKLQPTRPMRFVSSDGRDIFCGKNNTQNDRLTLHTAAPEDIWLHVKDNAGSHVIIQGEASDTAVLEAAHIAAYYSKARGGVKVPVDYTPRKHVKKPSGSPPGFVIYTTNQTVYVTPDAALVARLKRD